MLSLEQGRYRSRPNYRYLADLGAASGDLDKFIEGSARRALQISRPFDEYVFSEIGKNRARDLVTLRDQFPKLADRITILNMDANEAVVHFCAQLQPFDRAVIFLDPFGNQVPWKSLEIIAATERIDLWYLFPAGLGVARQIKKAGSVVAEAEASLDALFGGNGLEK